MVIRRRGVVMGIVTGAAFVVSLGYLWQFGDDHGIVPFLLAAALLAVAFVHAVAWRESRSPLLIADLTGVRVRLGGQWTGLPWSAVERVEVAARGRLGDGRVTVLARDESRALADTSRRARFAVLLNRWLYDAPLVVPFGLTTTLSQPDVLGTLTRLADGRAAVVSAEAAAAEPEPTVEVALTGGSRLARTPQAEAAEPAVDPSKEPSQVEPSTWFTPPAAHRVTTEGLPDLADQPDDEVGTIAARLTDDGSHEAANRHESRPEPAGSPPQRRLAAVVSALRGQAGRRGVATAAVGHEPVTVGTLALADSGNEDTERLPEHDELRRRPPEVDDPDLPGAPVADRSDVPAAADPDPAGQERDSVEAAPTVTDPVPPPEDDPSRTSNVELIIDATTDLSAQAMRKVRRRTPATLVAEESGEEPAQATAMPAYDTPPGLVIGMEIRRAREWLRMSVDDLAERTRIRPYVIESIEAGDFSPCGGDFYARGHLRMLAGVLGVDAESIVATYDAHLAGAPVSPRAVFDAELSTGVVRPTGGTGSRWGALVAAVLVLILAWGLAKVFLAGSTPGSSPAHTTANSAGLGSPGVGNTIQPAPPPTPPTRVTLSTTTGTSRVVVWDKHMKVVFQGVLHAGATKTVSGTGPLRVMAVDAGAVSMAGPKHPKAIMGQPGQRAFRHIG